MFDVVEVGSGRNAAALPLPADAGRFASLDDEQGVLTAFLALTGDLCVDEACDPIPLRVAAVASGARGAIARAARADADLLDTYLWGAAQWAARSGARTAGERRAWGAREMLTELALALRLPEGSLAHRLTRLATLPQLPLLREVHARGLASSWHVDAVLDVLRGIDDPAVLARADAFVAERAVRMTAPELRACARGWRARHVPRTDAQRRASLADRYVSITPADDDLCLLTALIPAAQAIAIDHRLDALAASARDAGDERTHAQARADVLGDLLLTPGAAALASGFAGAFDEAHAGEDAQAAEGAMEAVDAEVADRGEGAEDVGREAAPRCGLPAWVAAIRPEVVLTVPVLSLLGCSDEPATLEGFGPIDLETARLLAAGAPSFVRVLTHPETGAVLSVGRDRYRLPEDLKRAVRLRDVTCRFPGCRRRARGCDIDHSRAWQHGGGTELCNLACLCAKHHRLKHEMNWQVTHEPDGRLRWRTPTGHVYWSEAGDGIWPPRPAPPPPPDGPPRSASGSDGPPDEPPF